MTVLSDAAEVSLRPSRPMLLLSFAKCSCTVVLTQRQLKHTFSVRVAQISLVGPLMDAIHRRRHSLWYYCNLEGVTPLPRVKSHCLSTSCLILIMQHAPISIKQTTYCQVKLLTPHHAVFPERTTVRSSDTLRISARGCTLLCKTTRSDSELRVFIFSMF